MDTPRLVAGWTATLLIAVTLASGPLVGLSLTSEDRPVAPESGSADVTVIETPQTATLERARYGAGVYHLRAPPVELDVTAVSGQPTVTYQLAVPALGHTRSTTTFLDETIEGRFALELEVATLEPDRIERETYPATLQVTVRDDAGDRELVAATVDVVVEE